MLSKLFTTARTLLDRSSQAQGQELQQKDSTSEPVDNMVTTRLQGAQNTIDDRDAKRTSSSRKRQILSSDYGDLGSADDGEADVPANKKQKVLPLRAKDDEVPKRNTRPVVEIPVNRIILEHSSNIIASPKKPRKHSPTLLVPRDAERSTSNESKMEIPNSDSEGENSDLETAVTKLNNSKDTQKFSGEDVVKSTSANTSKAVPSASKARHKRFDSEEPEVMVVSNTVAKSDSEDESSDDDAPEVVGAQEALEQAKMKEREAAKAVEERESAIRRKRKERDAILKQQATSKRKREGELQRKKATPLDISPSRARGGVDEEHNKQTATTAESASPMKLAPGSSLPEFLPEEYLEDSESEDDMALEPVNPAKRAKKTKFVELVEKRPKDIRLGSTTYRVAEVRSTKLAPKSSFNARAVKESWLQGRGNASRKSFSSGFFKSR